MTDKNFILTAAMLTNVLSISSSNHDAQGSLDRYTHGGFRENSFVQLSMKINPLEYFNNLENYESKNGIYLVKTKKYGEKQYTFHSMYSDRYWAFKMAAYQTDCEQNVKIVRISIPKEFDTSNKYLDHIVDKFKIDPLIH